MKMQFQIFAISAFEARRDRALERKAAPFAKRRFNKARGFPARGANIPISPSRAIFAAQTAMLGVNEMQTRISPRLNRDGKAVHTRLPLRLLSLRKICAVRPCILAFEVA